MTNKALTDLPPELLDQITAYLPTANSLSNVSLANKSLHNFTEKSAWAAFVRARFPSLAPTTSSSWKSTARTLTTFSRALDRRGLAARFLEPTGDITKYPEVEVAERWTRPKGQTVGFVPQLDIYADDGVGKDASSREVLAYSTGAEVCLRLNDHKAHTRGNGEGERVRWKTYRPLSAAEGRDDVTGLHLIRPEQGIETNKQRFVSGTANGDLQLLSVPIDGGSSAIETYFVTQGLPVQSSSILQRDDGSFMLAAGLGRSSIALYAWNEDVPKIAPSSQVDIKDSMVLSDSPIDRKHRTWATKLISNNHLAVGLGPSEQPVHLYSITPSGINADSVRRLALVDPKAHVQTEVVTTGRLPKKPLTSIFPIHPLSKNGQVFLSGGYDGLVRLHDLRSSRDVDLVYSDGYDDSAIYSLLTRGEETILAGTSRNAFVKIFDMRLGSKCYSYREAQKTKPAAFLNDNWGMFLMPRSGAPPGRGGRRPHTEGSVYSLASAGPTSPYIYAGLQGHIQELAFTEVLHPHQDPLHFKPWTVDKKKKNAIWNDWAPEMTFGIAMYHDGALNKQMSLSDTWRNRFDSVADPTNGLDARWLGATKKGPAT